MTTNTISIQSRFNTNSGLYYWVIAVDGIELDELLDLRVKDVRLAGLVPTLLDWLSDPVERSIVWQRVFPAPGDVERLPILMCPDDIDFYCTLVIAEVTTDDAHVYWRRLGLDATQDVWQDLASVGSDVEWFADGGAFVFEKAAYAAVVNAFREFLEADAPHYPGVTGVD
jgi:hypothetical protein